LGGPDISMRDPRTKIMMSGGLSRCSRGLYRHQEVVLRQQLVRNLADPSAQMLSIVPTDCIIVPDAVPVLDVPALSADALANRPDLAQAGIQVQANELAASGSRNGVKPLLNLYANVQTRGSSRVPYQTIGSTGNEIVQVPPALTNGGLWLSTYIRQAFNSTQLTLAQPHRPIGRSARPDTTTPCRKSQPKARQ
jgi:hypothetical protein